MYLSRTWRGIPYQNFLPMHYLETVNDSDFCYHWAVSRSMLTPRAFRYELFHDTAELCRCSLDKGLGASLKLARHFRIFSLFAGGLGDIRDKATVLHATAVYCLKRKKSRASLSARSALGIKQPTPILPLTSQRFFIFRCARARGLETKSQTLFKKQFLLFRAPTTISQSHTYGRRPSPPAAINILPSPVRVARVIRRLLETYAPSVHPVS